MNKSTSERKAGEIGGRKETVVNEKEGQKEEAVAEKMNRKRKNE